MTPARAFYARQKSTPALLAWEPVYAAVSLDGDLGFTTGPWTYRGSPAGGVTSWGHYWLPIWRRHDNGAWRVLIDLGVSHPEPPAAQLPVGFPGDGRFAGRSAANGTDGIDRAASARAELQAVEAVFAARARYGGSEAAYADHAGQDIRLYREGAEPRPRPRTGAGRRAIGRRPGREVACSGSTCPAPATLAMPGAKAEPRPATGPSKLGTWVRIWSRGPEGVWRIVLDIMLTGPVTG